MTAKSGNSRNSFVDPDDAPEWTEAQFARAELAVGGKMIRPAQGTMSRRPGRPKLEKAKQHVSLRLAPDVIESYKKGGPGWQTRMAEVLAAGAGIKVARSSGRGHATSAGGRVSQAKKSTSRT